MAHTATATAPQSPIARRTTTGSGVSFGRVLKSEWIKVTTVPSTVILLAITLIVMVGFAALFAWQTTVLLDFQADPEMAAQMQGAPDATSIVSTIPGSGVVFGQLLIGSLAVVLIASEWGTGMIRSTMVAVPKRVPALLAKQLVFALIAFVLGAGSAFLGYLVSQPILTPSELNFSLGTDGVLLHIINTGSVLALVAVMAMSIGTLLRNTAGGVVTTIGLLFVVPILVMTLLAGIADWIPDAARFLPDAGAAQMVAIDIADGALNQWQGALVLGGWALGLLLISLLVTKKRDV
ncbi:ABC transporter permease [Arthrobacter tecti]